MTTVQPPPATPGLAEGVVWHAIAGSEAAEALQVDSAAGLSAADALQKMLIVQAKVRRDGQLIQVPAEQLVPGDVVRVEAGDLVPADGRLLVTATLEVAEAALTGESLPVSKDVAVVSAEDAPLG